MGYISGQTIKELREQKGFTQAQLAESLGVYESAVKSWEENKTYPDIMVVEPMAKVFEKDIKEIWPDAFEIRVDETPTTEDLAFYVCPICGNLVVSTHGAYVECCDLVLEPLAYEQPNAKHNITANPTEGGYHIRVNHGMSSVHYISCIIGVSQKGYRVAMLDHEGIPEADIMMEGLETVYFYCNKHGMFVNPIEA
ncbi:MAG: helix-turn-helix domain-containing protein [Eggerthellaceae bacterium]|nr:helix-turn-helix domain-containing protein [Eggerthellaceae bacterium]